MGNNGSAERAHWEWVREQERRAAEEREREQERRAAEERAREELERARKAAEEWERKVREEQEQRAAEEWERKVREEQEQARRAAEDREWRIRVQERARRAAEEKEREAQAQLERARRAAEEMEREAQAQLERARKAAEERERKVREELEQARRAAEEREREAQERLKREQKAAREREEEARKKLEKEQEDLRNGIEREILPTGEEIEAAKTKINYQNENLHFAVCGTAGSGKSSLINAIRGIRSGRPGAAKTGITETTTDIGRYPDHHTDGRSRFVWYDVPGAGTINIPGWQHFNDQGLYAFDFILVVIDTRVTKVDLQIIKNCQRFGIPTFILRSKADQHIQNLQNEMSPDDDQDTSSSSSSCGEGEGITCNSPYELARDKYISETRKSVMENLLQANLPDQPVYIICQQAMYRLMNGRDATRKIDEEKLLRDLLATALDERYSHRTRPSI